MSTAYYDANAQDFYARTVDANMSDSQRQFAARLPEGGHILEAGCGVGRDAKAFLDMGFRVTAFDGSPKMAQLATAHAGIPVAVMDFRDVAWTDAFDGVWASACLLHLPMAELPAVVGRLRDALKAGGVLEMSFKYGRGERLANGGLRHFTDLDEDGGRALVQAAGGLEIIDLEVSADSRPGLAHERWLIITCRRPPAA